MRVSAIWEDDGDMGRYRYYEDPNGFSTYAEARTEAERIRSENEERRLKERFDRCWKENAQRLADWEACKYR